MRTVELGGPGVHPPVIRGAAYLPLNGPHERCRLTSMSEPRASTPCDTGRSRSGGSGLTRKHAASAAQRTRNATSTPPPAPPCEPRLAASHWQPDDGLRDNEEVRNSMDVTDRAGAISLP